MKRPFRNGFAAAVAFSAAIAVAPAHAYVMGSAVSNITEFQIFGSSGAQLDFVNDFTFLTFTSTAGQTVSLTPGGSITNSAPPPPAPIDFAPICVGGGCNPILPDNSYPKLSAPPVAGNYAASDQREIGAPITNVPGFVGSTSASVGNAAYVGLTSNSLVGSGDSNNNLNSSFTFELTQATGISFQFLLDAYLQVAVSADEVFPGFATAALDVNFSIINLGSGATVWTYSPDVFGDGINTLSLNAPLPIDLQTIRDTGGPVLFSATTPVLEAGQLYQLSARNNTNVDAQRVQPAPEPALLSLVGIGLLAAGLGARRRKTSA